MSIINELIYSICHPGLINEIIIENENIISNHSLGIVIPTFNRPEYLKYVFYSLSLSDITESIILLIFDDGSEEITQQLIKKFKLNIPIIKIFINKLNIVSQDSYTIIPGSAFPFTIRYGFDILFQLGTKYVMNSDSDAMFTMNWLQILFTMLRKIEDPRFILSGFRCADEFHKVTFDYPDYAHLSSFGGINFTCNKQTFYEIAKDNIYDFTFDWKVSNACNDNNITIYLTKPSIVQHIGVHSSIIRGTNNQLSKCYDCTIDNITVDMMICLDKTVKMLENFPVAYDFNSDLWNKVIVISQPWGGLGDNLQFSTLPKLYSELGYEVYISKTNAYRNPEIYDLVWKLNPYIKGEIDKPSNAGACRSLQFITDQYITNIERSHDLLNGTEIYPIIYYSPKKIDSLENTIIYDITSITSSYTDEYIHKSFTKIFEKYPECDRKKIHFRNITNRETPDLHTDSIIVDNIFQYCDIIYSCKSFICLFSGGAVLASAIKQNNITPDIHCIHNRHSDIYVFNNITYHIE
jgi:hypothetical protein